MWGWGIAEREGLTWVRLLLKSPLPCAHVAPPLHTRRPTPAHTSPLPSPAKVAPPLYILRVGPPLSLKSPLPYTYYASHNPLSLSPKVALPLRARASPLRARARLPCARARARVSPARARASPLPSLYELLAY